MAVKNRATLASDIATLFADNVAGDISALDLRTFTGDDVDSNFNLLDDGQFNVLAGGGVDFTAGVDNSVTMPIASPGDRKSLVRVYFDGAFQAPDQYNIAGTTMTFTSTIPVGVESITIYVLA